MTKIASYTIVSGPIQIVVTEVNDYIRKGYTPYGQLLAFETYAATSNKDGLEGRQSEQQYSQAMVREEES